MSTLNRPASISVQAKQRLEVGSEFASQVSKHFRRRTKVQTKQTPDVLFGPTAFFGDPTEGFPSGLAQLANSDNERFLCHSGILYTGEVMA